MYASKRKLHTSSFVCFYIKQTKLAVGFVASKKVGNAIRRNKAKRRLRAMVLKHSSKLTQGLYLFVAKNTINNTNPKELSKQFAYTMNKMCYE